MTFAKPYLTSGQWFSRLNISVYGHHEQIFTSKIFVTRYSTEIHKNIVSWKFEAIQYALGLIMHSQTLFLNMFQTYGKKCLVLRMFTSSAGVSVKIRRKLWSSERMSCFFVDKISCVIAILKFTKTGTKKLSILSEDRHLITPAYFAKSPTPVYQTLFYCCMLWKKGHTHTHTCTHAHIHTYTHTKYRYITHTLNSIWFSNTQATHRYIYCKWLEANRK